MIIFRKDHLAWEYKAVGKREMGSRDECAQNRSSSRRGRVRACAEEVWPDRGGKGVLGNVSGQGRWSRALLKTHGDGK